LEPEQ